MEAEVVKVLLFLIIMAVAGVAQLVNKVRGADNAAGKGRPVRPRPQPLNDEIGEFLRRAAQQRREPSPVGQRPRQDPPPATSRPAQSPTADQPSRRTAGADVDDHVRKYMDTSAFERRETHLADDVTQADEKMDVHLRGVFDHRVGQLDQGGVETPAGQAGESLSVGLPALVALLTDPQNVRQAIVINEIFQRPEHRWS